MTYVAAWRLIVTIFELQKGQRNASSPPSHWTTHPLSGRLSTHQRPPWKWRELPNVRKKGTNRVACIGQSRTILRSLFRRQLFMEQPPRAAVILISAPLIRSTIEGAPVGLCYYVTVPNPFRLSCQYCPRCVIDALTVRVDTRIPRRRGCVGSHACTQPPCVCKFDRRISQHMLRCTHCTRILYLRYLHPALPPYENGTTFNPSWWVHFCWGWTRYLGDISWRFLEGVVTWILINIKFYVNQDKYEIVRWFKLLNDDWCAFVRNTKSDWVCLRPEAETN